MKVFITKTFGVYFFKTEADTNRNSPLADERMAGVSARKCAGWRKTERDFYELQETLKKLYEGTTDKS